MSLLENTPQDTSNRSLPQTEALNDVASGAGKRVVRAFFNTEKHRNGSTLLFKETLKNAEQQNPDVLSAVRLLGSCDTLLQLQSHTGIKPRVLSNAGNNNLAEWDVRIHNSGDSRPMQLLEADEVSTDLQESVSIDGQSFDVGSMHLGVSNKRGNVSAKVTLYKQQVEGQITNLENDYVVLKLDSNGSVTVNKPGTQAKGYYDSTSNGINPDSTNIGLFLDAVHHSIQDSIDAAQSQAA